MQHCTVQGCARDLPNKYAPGGRCEAEGCAEVFCRLHWNRSNHRCPAHGYQAVTPASAPAGGSAGRPPPSDDEQERQAGQDNEVPGKEGKTMGMESGQPVNEATKLERAKAAMTMALGLARKLGAGAASLLAKLKQDKSPEAMMKTIESAAAANQGRSADIAAKVESLYNEVVAKKALYEKAPPARKKTLEAELKTRLSAYKATEREYQVLLENERVLAEVKGRMMEVMAYGMAGVDEVQIDRLIDEVEEQVAAAEGRVDAARALEKAGRRRERESDQESFEEQLAGFETVGTASESPDRAAAPRAGEPAAREERPKEKTREAQGDEP